MRRAIHIRKSQATVKKRATKKVHVRTSKATAKAKRAYDLRIIYDSPLPGGHLSDKDIEEMVAAV